MEKGSKAMHILLGGDYDRTRAIVNGSVRPEGCAIQVELRSTTHEVFHTLCQTDDFDGGELSLSFYSTLLSKYGESSPFVALPIYLSRMFRHGNILVNTKAGIKSPKDLEGRRCGVPEYGMTMAVWLRGILRHEHDVNTDLMSWFTGRAPAALKPEELRYPPHVSIQRGVEQKRLVHSLSTGEIDSYIGPVPRELPANVCRLFSDYEQAEQAYFKRTSIFPIMHLLVLRRNAYERHKGAIDSIYRAFLKAKEKAIEDLWYSGALKVSLPWLLPAVERQSQIFSGDLWSYGLENNSKVIEAYLTYADEQGLLWKRPTLKEMFVPVSEG